MNPEPEKPTYSAAFWIGLVIGWAIIAFAARGLLDAEIAVPLDRYLRVFIGGIVVHDFLIVPTVLLIGVVVARIVPASVRGPVTAGLIVSGVVVVFSIPFVGHFGRVADNATILPRSYGTGLAIVLAAVWIVVAVVACVGAAAARRRATDAP